MADNSDATLMKVAVFGLVMSLMCTALVATMFSGTGGDYNYEEVQSYKDDLVSFSGDSMLNQNPWVLKHVFTPFESWMDASQHTTEDNWLYGNEITNYSSLNKSANIRLDSGQKSTVPLTYSEEVASYKVVSGYKWWSGVPVVSNVLTWAGYDDAKYSSVTADNWNYTGYRYVFDPTLPFSSSNSNGTTSTRDGSLSIVWYSFNNQEGLSGGLDVYGGEVLLASYSATDIIAAYNSTSGYATTYDFDFQGTHLTLSIKFDQDAVESGMSLMQAWTNGDWSMAISSVSAGNFFDIEDSTSFTATAGSMISTFISIYTFSMPSIDNAWMDTLLWLLVGLPMTLAMLLITLRLVNGFRVL